MRAGCVGMCANDGGKTNNNENNGGSLKPEWYQAYANYLVQYVKFYAEAGVNITHLGPMNEPDFR